MKVGVLMFCSNCGAKADGNFCNVCGAKLVQTAETGTNTEKDEYPCSDGQELIYIPPDFKITGVLSSITFSGEKIMIAKGLIEKHFIDINDVDEISFIKPTAFLQGVIQLRNANDGYIQTAEEASRDATCVIISYYKAEENLAQARELANILNVNLKTGTAQSKMQIATTKRQELDSQGIIYCPKCLCTQFSTDKKGFGIGKAVVGAYFTGGLGLMAGNINAKKVRVTCLKCGYQWWAGKK